MKNLRYLNKYLYKYRYKLILGIIFVSISNFFAIIPAKIIKYAYDLISENRDIYFLYNGHDLQQTTFETFGKVILLLGILILIMAVFKGIFMFYMRQTIIVMSRLIEYDLKNEVYSHFQKLPTSFYKRHNTGDLMTRVTEDISKVRMYLGPAIMYSINLIVLFTIVVSTMLYVNAELTLYVLLPLPILSVTIYYVSNIINQKSSIIQKQLSKLTTFCQEIFSGIRVIKSYAQENNFQQNFQEECIDYKRKSLSLAKVEALFFPLMILLIGLSTILTIYVGGLQVIKGEITTGNIAEFVIYINMLTWPVTSIGWIASIVQQAEASQKRINEFLKTKNDILSTKNIIKEIQGQIEFKNVVFTYPDTGIQAINNISFALDKGDKLAIIGRTGSGKSTLANLIMRLYDTTNGKILIDGIDIKEFDIRSLRHQIGYVPQESFLFSDTIANNIEFSLQLTDDEKLNPDTLQKTTKTAGILTDISTFPDGFDTLVGERGVTLSGGQKQRVTIARALIKNPKILLLDDCLSAVDTKTEKIILKNLDEILTNKTAIIITHRILSLKNVNRIIVLDAGEIAEEGTHNDLLNKKGLYYAIYQKQKLEERKMDMS